MNKLTGLMLVLILTTSSLVVVHLAYASTSSAPEFTVQIVAYPYDVPPTNTTTIDPYTGKETVIPHQGYHVENKSMAVRIRNNLGASYYGFRYKPHYADKWSYYPFDHTSTGYNFYNAYDLPNGFSASASEYTVLPLRFFSGSIPDGGQIDVQVQALFGHYEKHPSGMLAEFRSPTYSFVYIGTTSDWSETVTFIYDLVSPRISILSPEQNAYSTSDALLSFSVNEEINQTVYNLDGMENVTISGNTTLTNLPYGMHKLTVYAWDQAGNVGASESISFTVAVPFSTLTLVIIVLVSAFAIGAGLLVYFKKRKRQGISSAANN